MNGAVRRVARDAQHRKGQSRRLRRGGGRIEPPSPFPKREGVAPITKTETVHERCDLNTADSIGGLQGGSSRVHPLP